MIVKLAAAVALTASIGSAAYAGPVNLVTNGDFNSSTYTVNHQFGSGSSVPTSQGGAQGVDGWTGNGGYDLFFTSTGSATTQSAVSQYPGGQEDLWSVATDPAGGSFVAIDGDPSPGAQGAISQTVNGLKVGETYALTFSWGAGQLQSRTGSTTEQFQASLGGQSFLTNVVSNPSKGFTGWFTTTFDYTATSASELLSFLSVGTPTGLPPIATLDGVSLIDVPEPGSVGVLALGLGVVGLCFMRRRGATNAA